MSTTEDTALVKPQGTNPTQALSSLTINQGEEIVVKVSEVFARAAELLEEKGWVQNRYGNPAQGMCLYGACQHALAEKLNRNVNVVEVENSDDFSNPLFKLTDGEAPHRWNDKPGRSKDEVVSLLREAAKAVGDAEVSQEAPGFDDEDEELPF